MRLPWQRKPIPTEHFGIVLRIVTPAGEIVRADSEQLYFIAKYGGLAVNGWYELFPGDEALGNRDVRVEMSPRKFGPSA